MGAGAQDMTNEGSGIAGAPGVFTPLYARIQAHIRDGIASGAFLPGARLPSESQLAAQFGTTRATVVHALQKLVFDREVVRRVGSGTYVREAAIPASEGAAVGQGSLTGEAGTQHTTVEYRLLYLASLNVADRHGTTFPSEGEPDDMAMERLLLEAGQPVSLEAARLPRAIGQRLTAAILRRDRMPDILAALNLPLRRLEGTIRCAIATRRTTKLLQLSPSAPLLARDYRILDQSDQPLVHGTVWHRPGYRLFYGISGAQP